jgi:pimeloyl-ACP methyl ester carboxylesterase
MKQPAPIGTRVKPMPTWVLLRGLTRDSRHWGDFIERFRQAVAGARVVCVDLPGAGTNYRAESPIAIGAMVSHCRQALRENGVAPPYFVLGLSLGAMVAAEWAYCAADEIRACILLNTSMRPFSPFYRRLRYQSYPTVARIIAQGGQVGTRERLILGLVSNRPERRLALLPDWTAFQHTAPASPRNALRQLYAAARYAAPRTPPAVPILLLASKQDRLVDYACTLDIARHWGVPYRLHGAAGHDLPIDDGAWVIEQVKAWLAQRLESAPK